MSPSKYYAFQVLLFSFSTIYVKPDVSPLGTYNNFINLVSPDIYNLYWNYTSDSIIAEIHVLTSGWVSWGITVNGNLDNSDTMVAWVNSNDSTTFVDCYIKNKGLYIDKNQNWNLIKGTTKGGYTIIQFTRKINLCDVDTTEDLNIPNGAPYVSYSWGSTIPALYIDYFNSNTNVMPIPLLNTNQIPFTETNTFVQTYNFSTLLYTSLHELDDTFSCRLVNLSNLFDSKKHLIQVSNSTKSIESFRLKNYFFLK